MAEEKSTPPNHLGSDIPSGEMGHDHEKTHHPAHHKPSIDAARAGGKGKPSDSEEEEDEDMDALIDELESQDGQAMEEEEEEGDAGSAPPINEELLQTSTRTGLTDAEVTGIFALLLFIILHC